MRQTAILAWFIRKIRKRRFIWTGFLLFCFVILSVIDSQNRQHVKPHHASETFLSDYPVLSPLVSPKYSIYPSSDLVGWSPVANVPSRPGRPGDWGEPVTVPDDLARSSSDTFSLHQLNLVASDLVTEYRSLPDYRHPDRSSRELATRLPSVSVVIVFHNEPMSSLLRTVTSVVTRSPPSLLSQVILVSDKSSLDHSSLSTKITNISDKVELLTLRERQGLIRARLAGAKAAHGQVLVFLDSHIEVTHGWLEPLLTEITLDRTSITVPVVDTISQQTFAYDRLEEERQRSGFDWKLYHAWLDLAPTEEGGSVVDPFPTPTMVGCAFAVDREFFWEVGGYDDKMDIWGGENIEQSIRVGCFCTRCKPSVS